MHSMYLDLQLLSARGKKTYLYLYIYEAHIKLYLLSWYHIGSRPIRVGFFSFFPTQHKSFNFLLYICFSLNIDLKHDYSLSDEFRKHHYMVGLLLFELRQAMTEQRPIRRSAITVLRNQLAKHSFDDRYTSHVSIN